jgi:hypothetical protein
LIATIAHDRREREASYGKWFLKRDQVHRLTDAPDFLSVLIVRNDSADLT